jgi:hypothetical protein
MLYTHIILFIRATGDVAVAAVNVRFLLKPPGIINYRRRNTKLENMPVAMSSLRANNRVRFAPEFQSSLHKLGYPAAFDLWEVLENNKLDRVIVLQPSADAHRGGGIVVPVESEVFMPGVL